MQGGCLCEKFTWIPEAYTCQPVNKRLQDKDFSEDSSEDSSKDSSEDSSKDSSKDSSEDSSEEEIVPTP